MHSPLTSIRSPYMRLGFDNASFSFLTVMLLKDGAAGRSNLRPKSYPCRLLALTSTVPVTLGPSVLKGYQALCWGASTVEDNGQLDVQKQKLAMILVTLHIANRTVTNPKDRNTNIRGG